MGLAVISLIMIGLGFFIAMLSDPRHTGIHIIFAGVVIDIIGIITAILRRRYASLAK